MQKIAVVTSFSEKCYPLLKQNIVSCYQSMNKSMDRFSFSVFCYQCNWVLNSDIIEDFKYPVNVGYDLPLKDIQIETLNASGLNTQQNCLPDIVVYDDFVKNHIDKFDYVLFCHDDVFFFPTNMFSECVEIVSNSQCNLIAETRMETVEYISMRFYPHFIFVNTRRFKESNLSFINQYNIASPELVKVRDIKRDGGAGLLASFYSITNKTDYKPFVDIPKHWYQHLRFEVDSGIETYSLGSPLNEKYHGIMMKANRYVDKFLFGNKK